MAVAKAVSLAYFVVASKVAQLGVSMEIAKVVMTASKKVSGKELMWADSMGKMKVELREIRKDAYLAEVSGQEVGTTLEQ
jgi:superfamily II RNA helicase